MTRSGTCGATNRSESDLTSAASFEPNAWRTNSPRGCGRPSRQSACCANRRSAPPRKFCCGTAALTTRTGRNRQKTTIASAARRSAVSTTRSRVRPRKADAAVRADGHQHRRDGHRRRDVRTGRRGETELTLLKDDRPVLEEESEQRIQGHFRWLGACRLRGDCIAVRREPRRQGRGVGRVSLVCPADEDYPFAYRLGSCLQTREGQLLVRVNRPVQLVERQVLLAGVRDQDRPRPEQQRCAPAIEERHVGGEREHGGRKPRHRAHPDLRDAQHFFRRHQPLERPDRLQHGFRRPDGPEDELGRGVGRNHVRRDPSLNQSHAVEGRAQLRVGRQRDRPQRHERVDQLVDRRFPVFGNTRVRGASRRAQAAGAGRRG